MTWNKPENKLPDVDPKYTRLTKTVEVVTNTGEVTKAFCHIPTGDWYREDTVTKIFEGVMKWRDCE